MWNPIPEVIQMKHYLSFIPLFVLLVWAIPAQSSQSPVELVRETSTQMMMTLKSEKTAIEQEPARLYGLVADIVLPHFDFELMGRWTLGKYWRSADPQQRKEFVDEFSHLLVRTYGNALADYADAEIVYLPLNMKEGESRVKVRSEISQANNNPVHIVYSLHRTPGGWKVYDVAVEGVSLVTNYRNTFASKIREDGLDQLISQIARINNEAGST